MYKTLSMGGELRKKQLLRIIDDCEPKNVYNAGDIGLLFRLLLDTESERGY
jgi:hypothetical protein